MALQDFNVVITGFCKETAGSGLIQQGDYRILSSDNEEYINPKEISTMLQPGMTVEIRRCNGQFKISPENESVVSPEENRCPRYNDVNNKVVIVNGWASCRRCNGQFEISPENESIISPAAISILQDDRRKKEVIAAKKAEEADKIRKRGWFRRAKDSAKGR
ncbi:hypothetical protein FIBSPDRAFT_938474 [Athelia psychrophila]|uniref:Ubiquitin-like domain-containing protein n=1 Tax=Athelia psychrophila TaxID=1759441 RepID=A0A165YEK6_9AGAM|nr:hypothetical protein FIBSPDRAFT_938474 [Fibularhizoctonia sp. CBS 109695]